MDELVSLQIAKLFKEKGFPQNKYYIPWYNEIGHYKGRKDINREGKTFSQAYPEKAALYGSPRSKKDKAEFSLETYAAMTIGQSIMWLYENHGIWIYVSPKTVDTSTIFIPHGKTIPNTIKNGLVVDIIPYTTKISPIEAYEAAIGYTLNNLI